jgi:glycosyltransferase involved in cell wall biosynthesis
MPEVSVITAIGPRSGHQRFLEQAYNSLLESSLSDWEWCLQLDAGADAQSSRDIRYLEHLSIKDPRIRLGYNSSHFGMSVTRNLALLRARADLAQALDSDDMLLEDTLKDCSEIMKKEDVAFVFGEALYLHEERLEDREEEAGSLSLEQGFHPRGELTNEWIDEKKLPFLAEGIMWRTEKALAYGGFSALPNGGDETLALAVAAGENIFYHPKITFVKRLHQESTSRWQAGQEARQIDGTKALLALHRLGRIKKEV